MLVRMCEQPFGAYRIFGISFQFENHIPQKVIVTLRPLDFYIMVCYYFNEAKKATKQKNSREEKENSQRRKEDMLLQSRKGWRHETGF